MDQRNTSSHPLIPSNFASAATNFPAQLTAGLQHATTNVGTNPLFMSTLQQLGLSTNTGLLHPQSSLNTTLTNDFTNWSNNHTAAWLDQAKMAAMYNSMLQSTVNERQNQYDLMEQSLKVAAAAARAPPSLSSAALNLATQQAGVNALTHATDPLMAAVVAAATNPLPNISKSIFPNVAIPEALPSASMTTFPSVSNKVNVNGLGASASTFGANDTFTNSLFLSPTAIGSHSLGQSSTSNAQLLNVITPTKNSTMDTFTVSDLLSFSQQQHQSAKMFSPIPCSTTNQLLDCLMQQPLNQAQSHQLALSQIQQATNQQSVQLQNQLLQPQPVSTVAHSLPSTSTTKDVTVDDLLDLNDLFPGNKDTVVSIERSIFVAPIVQQPISQAPPTISISLSKTPPPPSPPPSKSLSTQLPPKNREMESEKELNHWLSLAVGGNLPDDDHHGSPLSNFGDVPGDNIDLFSTETTGFSLDPIMFTPPDSPTHEIPKKSTSKPALKTIAKPSTSQQDSESTVTESAKLTEIDKHPPSPKLPVIDPSLFLAKPKVSTSNERVPVYKRQTFETKTSSFSLEKVLTKVAKAKVADEYSFTDDEEDVPPSQAYLPFSMLDTSASDDEAKKLGASTSEDVKPIVSTDTFEGTGSKKRTMGNVSGVAGIDNQLAEEKGSDVVCNNLAKIIQKRHEVANSLPHVYVFGEILKDETDDAIIVTQQPDRMVTVENAQQEEALTVQPKEEPMELDNEALAPVRHTPSSSTSESPPVLPINEPTVNVTDEPMDTEQQHKIVIKQEIDDEAPQQRPVIPKLVIKLARRDSVASPIVKKRKKKHKKHKERDEEWQPPDEKRRKKKKHKHRHRDSEGRRIRSRSIDVECLVTMVPPTLAPMHDNQNHDEHGTIEVVHNAENETIEFVQKRLECFGVPSGDSPKGTFVVCKQDIFNNDCPLWKVDNQNLLQKYPQFYETVGTTKVMRYKNSSTYSGWCDQVAAGYMIVKVKYHKHSRNETIVEPEVPIVDLFPAMAINVSGQDAYGQPEDTDSEDVVESFNTVAKDAVQDHMRTFTHAMLKHAATLGFLQTVKNCNDWSYMCALSEVENMTSLGKQRINDRVKWGQRFEVMLTVYPNAIASKCFDENETCQGCGNKAATKGIQLFANWSYNYDSLEIEKLPDIGGEPPLVAIEFCLCNSCAHLALIYHRLHHMKFTTLRYCEEMLENVSALKPELSVEAVISHCMSRRGWQRRLVNEYVALWRKVQQNDL